MLVHGTIVRPHTIVGDLLERVWAAAAGPVTSAWLWQHSIRRQHRRLQGSLCRATSAPSGGCLCVCARAHACLCMRLCARMCLSDAAEADEAWATALVLLLP